MLLWPIYDSERLAAGRSQLDARDIPATFVVASMLKEWSYVGLHVVACFFYIECLVATRHCTGTEVINKRLANVVLELIVPIPRFLDSKGLPSGVGRIVEKERIVAQDADIDIALATYIGSD